MSVFLALCLLAVHARADWELVWHDEFNGDSLDMNKWGHEITQGGGGNNEFQVYTNDPLTSYVQDGKLFIKPMLFEEITNPQTGEPYGPDFRASGQTLDLETFYGECSTPEFNGCTRTGLDIPPTASARLRTKGKFAFRYGRVEIRAKMPTGDWLWPALWMLPENWCYGGWPLSGEIDINESIGNEDLRWVHGYPAGIQHCLSTLHWGMDYSDNRWNIATRGTANEENDFGRNMHSWVFEWTPNGLSFLVDNYRLLDVPYPLIDQKPDWAGFFEWGKPWNTIDENDPNQNPWRVNNEPLLVPFDTQFHFLFNVAVGGTNGYISDHAINRGGDPQYAKPWNNGQSQYDAMNDFYNARDAWKWTWDKEGDNLAMQVDYVRVYKDETLHPEEQNPDCPALAPQQVCAPCPPCAP